MAYPDMSGLYNAVPVKKVDLEYDRASFKAGEFAGKNTFSPLYICMAGSPTMTYTDRAASGKKGASIMAKSGLIRQVFDTGRPPVFELLGGF